MTDARDAEIAILRDKAEQRGLSLLSVTVERDRYKRLHDIMYAELERLVTLDPAQGSEEGAVLKALATLAEAWERETFKL